MAARRALLDEDFDFDLTVAAPSRAAVEPEAVAFVQQPARRIVENFRSRNRRRGIGLLASFAGIGLLMSTISASAAVAEAPLTPVTPAAAVADQLSRGGALRVLDGTLSVDETVASALPAVVVAQQVADDQAQPEAGDDAAASKEESEPATAETAAPEASSSPQVTQTAEPEVAEAVVADPLPTREPEIATAVVPTASASGAAAGTAGLSMAACASGSGMESGLVSNAIKAHRAVCANFPSIKSYGGVRPGDPGYHGSGQAVDIMVSGATGTSVANFLIANHKALGVTQVIYQQRIWLSSTGAWKGMSDRGSITQNHFDHVHVSVR